VIRSLLLVLLLLLAGCGLPSFEDPGNVVLADDDDDSAATDDDDDDASDDDDATNPDDADRSGVVWLLDRHLWSLPDAGLQATDAGAAFWSEPPSPMSDTLGPAGLPVPGLLLHPDLDPFAGDEGCEPVSSTDPRGPLPPSDDVGAAVHLFDESGSADLEVPAAGPGYALAADGEVLAATLGLALDGGETWPGSDSEGLLAMPDLLTGVVPTPGTLSGSGLAALHVQWSPDDPDVAGARIEILVVRFATAGDESAWEGVRCLALDDGTYTLDASALIAAGSGDLQLSLSRANWAEVEADNTQGRPHLDGGAIRAVWFRAVVGG